MEGALSGADDSDREIAYNSQEATMPQVKSSPFRTDTDILMAVSKKPELSPSHRDAISAIRLFQMFDKEEAVADDITPADEELESLMHNTWNIICYILQKRILENCAQIISEAPLNKNRLRQTRQSKEIFSVHTSELCNLMQYGRMLTSVEKPIHSIVALYACANINKLNAKGDSSVYQIQKCSWLFTFAFEKLASDEKVYDVVTHHLIPFLSDELTRFIRSVQTSCHKFRTENEAWCIMRMGISYECFGDDINFALMCENAASLIRRKFKKDTRFHQVYAMCLSNAAAAYIKRRNMEKAQEFITRSVEAYEKVRDWQEGDKEYLISILKFNITIKQDMAVTFESENNILETDL